MEPIKCHVSPTQDPVVAFVMNAIEIDRGPSTLNMLR